MELEKVKTLKDFIDASIKITHQKKDDYERFLWKRIERLGYSGGLQEYYIPIYNEYSGNFRYRYIIFNIGDDEVGIIFKYVMVHTTRYIRIMDYPISLLDNSENETLVYNYLVDNNIIKQRTVVVPNDSEKYIDQNFYNIVSERWNHINRSKWRTARGVNIVLNDPNFLTKKLETSDFENVYKTFDLWGKYKLRLSKKNIVKMLKIILNFTITGEAEGICHYYKNALIGFSIWVPLLDGTYINHIRNMNLMRVPNEVIEKEFNVTLDESFNRVHKELGSIMHYYLMKYHYELGSKVFYVGGAGTDTGIRLPENKIKDNSYEIKYNVVECKEK